MSRLKIIGILSVMVLLCGVGYADPVHVGSEIDGGIVLHIASDWSETGVIDPYTGYVIVGPVPISIDGAPSVEGYCVDLQHFISPPTYADATLASISDWDGFGLFTTPNLRGERAAFLYATYAGTVGSLADRVALQLAIWEVLYEVDSVSYDITSGVGFRTSGTNLSSDIENQAAFYLSNAGLASPSTDATWLQMTRNGADIQDFIVRTPEPATLLLLGLGLLAAGVSRRRS